MLGIASDLKIVCDYTLSVDEVQLDFIYQSLKSGDLTALHYCKNELSPSFVPCLRPQFDTEYLPVRSSASPFEAGQRFSVDLKLNVDQTLSLRGVLIDEVRDIEHLDDPTGSLDSKKSATYMAEVLQDVLHCLRDHYRHTENDQHRHLDPDEPAMEYETIVEVIGRNMNPDVTALATNDNRKHSKKNWLSAPVNKLRHQARLTAQTLDNLHYWQIMNKVMFRTVCGYIGFGIYTLLPGDLIAIFDGAKTPFLIRKEHDPHGVHTGRYTIVSDCYLHGWMYGDYFGHTILEEGQILLYDLMDQSPEVPLYSGSGNSDRDGMNASPEAERGKYSRSTTRDTSKRMLRKQTFVIC